MNKTLDILNNIGEKKYAKSILSIKDIPFNESWRIIRCDRKITIYGLKIALELEEYIMFLPEKYSYIADETIQDLSTGKYYIKKVSKNGIYYKLIFEMDK